MLIGDSQHKQGYGPPGNLISERNDRFQFWCICLRQQAMHSPPSLFILYCSHCKRSPQLLYLKRPKLSFIEYPYTTLSVPINTTRSAVRLPPASPALLPVGIRGNVASSAEGRNIQAPVVFLIWGICLRLSFLLSIWGICLLYMYVYIYHNSQKQILRK